ncbi:transposase [Paraburkholderia caballeronis]|uniref:transposase n=1 Tax=Paraburkholderia caballeronis TaxID=416943 RepID=UPI0014170A25|nr:transposase [Paraburkholderia caballeronis]
MKPWRDITEEEWQRVMPLLPELRPRSELRGRPLANTRAVLNGVLWVMYSGATWSAMPRRYPSYQTCHRRFKAWYDEGVLKRVMAELFGDEGVALCNTIEARMRKHASAEEKAARLKEAALAPAAPFAPTAPNAPPSLGYRVLLRQPA